MTGRQARRRGVRAGLTAAIAFGLAGAAGLALSGNDPRPEALEKRAPGERPVLMLLTSLPLVFPEGFAIEGGSPALTALEKRYRTIPISATDAGTLGQGELLLMAQPLAQTADNLVALDRWVRSGGRVLLLADPALDWPSGRPLGDRLRPPPMFADTGLLRHWGLTLSASNDRGPTERRLAGYTTLAASPGALSGRCPVTEDSLVARCSVGRGRATVVGDADFINVDQLDGPTDHNLDALLKELDSLER